MKAGKPFYELAKAIPELNDFYFSLIGGVEYRLPLALFSVVAGVLSAKLNRKYFLVVTSLVWSCVTLVESQARGVNDFQACMILYGILSAVLNPVSLSLIRDYFPPSQRSQANAWYATVIYLGGAMAALSNFSTCFFGWKNTYNLAGAIGLLVGGLGLAVLREPRPGQFDPETSISISADGTAAIADESAAVALTAEADGAAALAESADQPEEQGALALLMDAVEELKGNDTAKWVLAGACIK